MGQFKVGDVVRRIEEANEDSSGNRIEVDDVLTVNKVNTSGWLFFEGPFTGGSNPLYFELASKRGFKVGDKVRRKPKWRRTNWALGAQVVTVTEVSAFAGSAWIYCDPRGVGGFASRFDLVEAAPTAPVVEHTSRANDPATSRGVRKTNKYEQAVLLVLSGNRHDPGYTGKEIAEASGCPLNCITPRLAPLRRKGIIKALEVLDAGVYRVVKRDKQIVWVLA